MGWGVAEQETFAHQVIERLAKQGRKVDGFNEGVGNWNTVQELANFRDVGMKMKPDIVVLTYFINDGEPMPAYPKESWLDLHSAAWIVLNYRLDSLIRQFGPRPDWKHYYRNLYNDDAAGWQATQKAIAGFGKIARSNGIQIVVFHLPELRELKPYPFQDVKTRAQSYWRDVGTLDAYYDANLELVHVRPELNIYDQDWPIWTYQVHQPPAKFILDEDGRRGMAVNSMVSGGCIISGAVVRQSLVFSNVHIDESSSVERSVLLPHVSIGKNCKIVGAIVDEGCEIPDGMCIGLECAEDTKRFYVTEKNVVLVTADMIRRL